MKDDILKQTRDTTGAQIAERMIEQAFERKQARDARGRFVREALDRLNPVTDAPNPYVEPVPEVKPLHLCRRYNCTHDAATASGDCLICAEKDRIAQQVVEQQERIGMRWSAVLIVVTCLLLVWALWHAQPSFWRAGR